jgi:hypothetical protein
LGLHKPHLLLLLLLVLRLLMLLLLLVYLLLLQHLWLSELVDYEPVARLELYHY